MKPLHQFLAILLLLSGGLVLQAKPKKKEGTKDPEANFEELWQTFHKRYAFFELREVDWKKQYETFRPKVTKETSDEELFRVLCEMLAPLKDGHVNLKARGAFKGKFNPEDKPFFHREFAKQRLIDDLFRLTEKNLGEKGFSEAKTTPNYLVMPDRTNWATCARTSSMAFPKKRPMPPSIGYSKDSPGWKLWSSDVRHNPGGTDAMLYCVAGRFADKERVGHHCRTKKGPGSDEFGPLETKMLKPLGKTQFTKPVVLLTSDAYFSTADVFAMVMKELPHIRIIGDHTNGICSNMFETKLPNGWRYTFTYQHYYSPEMVCFETKGIPVHDKVPNTKADLETGIDRALEVALTNLAKRT